MGLDFAVDASASSAWEQAYPKIINPRLPLSERTAMLDAYWRTSYHDIELPVSLEEKIVPHLPYICNDLRELFCGFNIKSYARKARLASDEESKLWDIFHQLYPDFSQRSLRELESEIGLHTFVESRLAALPSLHVLDIGCGTDGRGLSELCSLYSGRVSGTGVDLAVTPYENAEVCLVPADARVDIPVEDESVDLAYSVGVLYYFDDAEQAAATRHVLRSLKPGGTFLVDYAHIAANVSPSSGCRARVRRLPQGTRIAEFTKK